MVKNNTVMTVAILLAAAFFLSGNLTGNAIQKCADDRRFGDIRAGGKAVIVDGCGNVLEYCSDYAGSGVQTTHPFVYKRLSAYKSVITCRNPDLRTGTQEPTLIGSRPEWRSFN